MKEEKIWVECTCDYEGFADMVKFEGMNYQHPVCPNCGELIEDIEELSSDEWNKKTKLKVKGKCMDFQKVEVIDFV